MPIAITRFAVAQRYALAIWIGGDDGGEAVFIKGRRWRIVSLHGGGVEDVANLEALGIPASDAKDLIGALRTVRRRAIQKNP